ncbi:MAG: dcm [Segetibacter sp.]|nr:dcm [Segetibacter sp.]
MIPSGKIIRGKGLHRTFTFIDLFAGIGGMRMPFSKVGGICVFSSEWDAYAQQTYHANFGEVPHGDITKIAAKDIPPHDILLAGFPCQPFSQAGHKKGFSDIRGTAFFEIARIVKYHHPSMLLLENVKGLVTHDSGRTCTVIKGVLQRLDYAVFDMVLNARDFGLPQHRERLYIVAVHTDKVRQRTFHFPTPPKIKTIFGSILETNVPAKYTLSDTLWAGHQRRKKEHECKGNGFGYRLFTPASQYTSTLSARYSKDGAEILIAQKGKNPRKLTPREAARLQGFPDTFTIPVIDTQAYKQFGNSVAIPVLEAIALQMVNCYRKQFVWYTAYMKDGRKE